MKRAAEGDNAIVKWWKRDQTAEVPVTKISTDNGATFGSETWQLTEVMISRTWYVLIHFVIIY